MASLIFKGKVGMIRYSLFLMGLFVSFISATSSHASTVDAFNDDVSKAYAAYRSAANYLRTDNPGIAFLELSDASDVWANISNTYATNPPSPYIKDTEFRATLLQIAKVLTLGRDLAESGDSKSSLKMISPIRGVLYNLRKRNGIRLYADCITELNRAMEPIFVHRRVIPDLYIEPLKAQITNESRTYQNLLTDCRGLAPASYTSDQEFIRLFDGTMESITSIFPAIESRRPQRVINVIRELRSFDRIIYFKFGG